MFSLIFPPIALNGIFIFLVITFFIYIPKPRFFFLLVLLGLIDEVVFDIILGGGATAVYHAIGPEDVDRIMRHPATAIGSDGPVGVFGEGAPHPRQYGTFARVLGHYVRERGVISLEEAVKKMSSQSARRLGIHDRGLITEGYFADVAVFDAEEIIDRASFELPHQYATGMKFVLVNGELVVEDGVHNGSRPGRILHGPGYTTR